MTTGTQALMNLGMPAAQARRIGLTPTSRTGVGTTQAGATLLGLGELALFTTAGGQTAFLLPSDAAIGDEIHAYTVSSTTALVFPEVGAAIDGGSANASVNVAQAKRRVFTKTANLTWVSALSA